MSWKRSSAVIAMWVVTAAVSLYLKDADAMGWAVGGTFIILFMTKD